MGSDATPVDLSNQTILITGATNGIGLITARELARMGAQVVIIGRNPGRTTDTVKSIRQTTGNSRVDGLVGDLAVQAEVHRLAEEYRQRYGRLTVLINNAGAVFFHRLLSADGFEMTLALNHLSYFMLTNLLVDLVTADAPARIINVSSLAHWMGRINLDDVANSYHVGSWTAYSQTKLMNVLFTYELARRLEGKGVAVNCLHPGFVATNFGKSNGGIFRSLWNFFDVAAISPERGARTTIYLASSPEAAKFNGQYFVRSKPQRSSRASYDRDLARRLWDLSRDLTGVG